MNQSVISRQVRRPERALTVGHEKAFAHEACPGRTVVVQQVENAKAFQNKLPHPNVALQPVSSGLLLSSKIKCFKRTTVRLFTE
jgi:hypothetical protein